MNANQRAGNTPERNGRSDDMMVPYGVPDRVAIDANGYGWRVWDDSEFWSMVPTNPDNNPIPQPVTWFVKANEATIQQAIDEWAAIEGGPARGGPTLARYIAVKLGERHA